MLFTKCLKTIIFLIFSQFLLAQTSVSGFLLDETGNVIINHSVKLISLDSNAKYEVKTTTSGYFYFKSIANGAYNLQAVHNLKNIQETIQVKGQNVEVDLSFKAEKNNMLDDVVIKVQSAKAEIEQRGFAVNVIETKEASLRNMQTNELLDRVAGVKIRQEGGLGSRVNYNINGMTGNHFL